MTNKYTPMINQYLQIKEQHQNEILFFRLGDFYEMFFEDAQTASRELEITLTGRDGGAKNKIPFRFNFNFSRFYLLHYLVFNI